MAFHKAHHKASGGSQGAAGRWGLMVGAGTTGTLSSPTHVPASDPWQVNTRQDKEHGKVARVAPALPDPGRAFSLP